MSEREALLAGLGAWRAARRSGRDHAGCCARAVEALLAAGTDRWTALEVGSALARAAPLRLSEKTRLGRRLQPVRSDRGAVAVVPAGEEAPVWDAGGRKRGGAFDTPPELARRVVQLAREAAVGDVHEALDPACGTGAFLLALDEAGVRGLTGVDASAAALAVAAALVPRARLVHEDAFAAPLPEVDAVVGNPPFVAPEHQAKAQRVALARRFPWLRGRFDLAVPFAALGAGAVRAGGGLGLVLPASMFVQPYGETWRRRWLAAHRFRALEGPLDFPGAAVKVQLLGVTIGVGPGVVPGGLEAAAVQGLPAAPLDPKVGPEAVALRDRVRERSVPLGSLCTIDTGLVAHGPFGGKARLLSDEPGPGRVPFVDARDLFDGRLRYLRYVPEEMHRPKSPGLFEGPKLLVQRLRGGGPVRAVVDREGRYAGHTLLVAKPLPDCPVPPERLLEAVRSPVAQAVTRIERGPRLDLYPRDLRELPVPKAWLRGGPASSREAWGLEPCQLATLAGLASF